ncbi:transposable element Tcb1 transposase [Trichonephila clavipes]|nr:transposable element Tcb1 transposase [Trichonephila clavipes]
MSSRHHIDDFMRGQFIGKIEEGRKITDVAREFDIAHNVVSRLRKSFKTTGMCSRRHGGGRVRSTTSAEDRYIILSAKRNRSTTAQQVANQFLAASGKQISRKTVARRLRGGGLYARRPVVCVPLTRQHRTARLQWCREHHNWTEQDWECVLFSDDSRFSLSSDCRRQLIWRESGTAYRPENIQEKDRYPTCSIMVWAGIMINGRTRLHVVANGTMTGQRYIDEVVLPHVRLFRGAVGDKFVFMDDNATCHRTLAVQDCLDSEGIQRLVWPARSPDLNPIENVWDALVRQVAGRNYPPTNKNTLIRALTEEWDKLPQQLLDNVVQSMVRPLKVLRFKFFLIIFSTISSFIKIACPRDKLLFSGWQSILEAVLAMASIPITSFSAPKIHEHVKARQKFDESFDGDENARMFHQNVFGIEKMLQNYNNKLMNSIWGQYNLYAAHAFQKNNEGSHPIADIFNIPQVKNLWEFRAAH